MYLYKLCLGCVQAASRFICFPSGTQRSPTTQLEPTNQHPSIDVTDLNFVSEAIGMPALTGHGWAQFGFGDQIGQGNRYTIVRKLGRGIYSSAWLARDNTNEFVAVKALTGYMTLAIERSFRCEATVLRLISRQPTSPHCTLLLDEFTIPGKGSARSHLCFVMPVYGGDVRRLGATRTTLLPLPLVKRITLHLLRGIVHTHGRGVVHTDIKLDNIFFSTTMTTDDIEAWVVKDPSRRHAPEASHDGMVQAAVSQPLPMISDEEAMRATYVLADFGCEPSDLHDNHRITSLALRPPEVYLGAAWDIPVDIWSFGCLIFELITSRHLFRYYPNPKFGMDETENMLYQMMLHTGGDPFRAEQLQVSPKAPEYFNADCELKKNPGLFYWPIRARFIELKIEISDEDATATEDLIERCLQLNPADRPTAAELLNDPWFDGVE